MSSPAEVALLVPAYNAEAHLPRLLSSAQDQSVPFADIWVYDDASTDRTRAVAESHGAKVLAGDSNVGCSMGKHRLLMQTECEYVHFHDADDDLDTDFVENCQSWLGQANPPEVVIFSYREISSESGQALGVRHFDDEAAKADTIGYALSNQINPFCGLYKRQTLLNNKGYQLDDKYLYNEDVYFHLRLAFSGVQFRCDSRICVTNIRRSDSMSSANPKACVAAQIEVMKWAASQVISSEHQSIVARKLCVLSGLAGAQSMWQEAVDAARLARNLDRTIPFASTTAINTVWKTLPSAAVFLRELAIRISGRRRGN